MKFKEGDVLFGKLRPYLEKYYLAENDGYCTGEILAIEPIRISGKFLKYFIGSPNFIKQCTVFSYGTKMPRVNWQTQIGVFSIVIPPMKEQQVIVDYLDKATDRIDRIIDIKQEQLDRLEKAYSSESFKLLTSGIGKKKDTDFVDIDIDWLIKIPKNWRVKRLKDVVNMKSGNSISAAEIDKIGTYPVYGGNGLRGYTESFTHDGCHPLMGRQGALCGNINYADGKFFATEHAVVVTPIHNSNIIWIGELMRVMNLNQYSNAAAQPGLSVDKIKQLYIPVPPRKEQEEIASALKRLERKNNNMCENLNSQIQTLNDYRKSLIHECVTGKKQVADIAQ